MTWRTHAAGGVAALWLIAPFPALLTDQNAGTLAAAAALGALLPDLDAADAKARHLGVCGLHPLEPVGDLLHALFGHRGLLHSLPGLALFALLVALPLAAGWGADPSMALVLGYASHLALDACTVRGIPLLPARRKDGRWGFRYWGLRHWGFPRSYHLPPRPLRVVTGSAAEEPVFFLLALAALALLLRVLAEQAAI